MIQRGKEKKRKNKTLMYSTEYQKYIHIVKKDLKKKKKSE